MSMGVKPAAGESFMDKRREEFGRCYEFVMALVDREHGTK